MLSLVAAALAFPAQAGWSNLDIVQGAPQSARPNFNYARACKTAMNLPGVGPVFRVRLEVERNPAISSGSFITAVVTDGAAGPDLSSQTNHGWYGAWSAVEIYAPIFADIAFAFAVGDATKGTIQVGRHYRADIGAYRFRWRGDELATC